MRWTEKRAVLQLPWAGRRQARSGLEGERVEDAMRVQPSRTIQWLGQAGTARVRLLLHTHYPIARKGDFMRRACSVCHSVGEISWARYEVTRVAGHAQCWHIVSRASKRGLDHQLNPPTTLRMEQ